MKFRLYVTLSQYLTPVPLWIHTCCVTLILLLGIGGNSYIIHHYRRKRKRTSGDIFYIALAIVDLFAVIIVCPQWPIQQYLLEDDGSKNESNDDNPAFVVFLCTVLFGKISYMSLIAVMSMDRFFAVYFPTRYNQSPKRIAIVSLVTITTNCILSSFPAFGTSFVYRQAILCTIVLIFITCSLCMVGTSYTAILYKVRQSKRKVGNVHRVGKSFNALKDQGTFQGTSAGLHSEITTGVFENSTM